MIAAAAVIKGVLGARRIRARRLNGLGALNVALKQDLVFALGDSQEQGCQKSVHPGILGRGGKFMKIMNEHREPSC